MGPELHENADNERRGWAISRRRKLAAVIVGIMMLTIAWDRPAGENLGHDASRKDSGEMVTIDEFDRIEALLARTETPKATGRGPTVEVPENLALSDERPAFDFGAFDQLNGENSKKAQGNSQSPQDDEMRPPSRNSFDDRSSRQELQIPVSMALGKGGQDALSGGPVPPAPEASSDLQSASRPDPQTLAVDSESQANPVKIITSDVTTSSVTRFDQPQEKPGSEEAGRIRFTGTIFPVSRPQKID